MHLLHAHSSTLHNSRACTLALLGMLLVGCDSDEGQAIADDLTPRALVEQRGDYFEVELVPPGMRGQAMRAEAYLVAHSGVTRSVPPVGGGTAGPVELTGTCGLTFVSPHHAITAAHCVDGVAPYGDIDVRIPRLGRGYDWTLQTEIDGVYPAYDHELNPAYVVEQHTCELVVRCGDESEWGPHIACDIGVADVSFSATDDESVQARGDVAMVRCDAPLGERFGHVEAAEAPRPDAPLTMPWFHELYDIDEGGPSDLVEHYIMLAHSFSQLLANPSLPANYHYIGGDDRHQPLPLMSTDAGMRWRMLSSAPAAREHTTLLGCHGTSGSGVMQPDAATGLPELLGPAADGSFALHGRLCYGSDEPETEGLWYNGHEYTRHFAAQAAAADCTAPPSAYPSVLWYWLVCGGGWLTFFEEALWWNPFPECPACNVFSRVRGFQPPVALVSTFSAGTSISLGLQQQQLGTRYRASVRVYGVDMPAVVTLRLGNTVLASHQLGANDDEWVDGVPSRLLTGSFVASAATSGELTVDAVIAGGQGGTLGVSDIVLIEDGRTGVFEHRDLRDSFALITSPQQPAQVMRYAAGTSSTFAAVLEPGERMVANAQALVADRRWALSLSLSESSALSCGLLLADGSELVTPCAANGNTTVLDGLGAPTPVAWFVDNVGQSVAVIEDAAIAEVAACAHDTCATGAALAAACDPCVDAICDVDPYCCTTAWDSLCVGEVRTVCDALTCPDSAGGCVHGHCVTGAALKPVCDVPPLSTSCVSAICSADPYCCSTAWDTLCVSEVASICQMSCD